MKNLGGWGENALKGLVIKAWEFSDKIPKEKKKKEVLTLVLHILTAREKNQNNRRLSCTFGKLMATERMAVF